MWVLTYNPCCFHSVPHVACFQVAPCLLINAAPLWQLLLPHPFAVAGPHLDTLPLKRTVCKIAWYVFVVVELLYETMPSARRVEPAVRPASPVRALRRQVQAAEA